MTITITDVHFFCCNKYEQAVEILAINFNHAGYFCATNNENQQKISPFFGLFMIDKLPYIGKFSLLIFFSWLAPTTKI